MPSPSRDRFSRKSLEVVLEHPKPDEYYVLVTQYYPRVFRFRELSKEEMLKETPIDYWDRQLAPSRSLHNWWKEGPKTRERWEEYKRRFLSEVPPPKIRKRARFHKQNARGREVVFVCHEKKEDYPYCHTWILLEVIEGSRSK